MKPRRVAWALIVVGTAIAVYGVALFSIPLAILLAGVAIAAVGLLAIEVSP